MKLKANRNSLRKQYWTIGGCVVLLIFIELLKGKENLVETYYSRGFYPVFSYLYIVLFSWIPISVGDIFYVVASLSLLGLLVGLMKSVFQKNIFLIKKRSLQLISLGLILYTLFYVNWGLNYYRIPVAKQLNLAVDTISKEDHLAVLERYITIVNQLRNQVNPSVLNKNGVSGDIKDIIRSSHHFDDFLALSQLKVKSPLSSELVSYFTVSGYFNPFTLEAQVNQAIPNSGYPFTVVHELMHQQGIGFEDECNYLAFRMLCDHQDDAWYRYSAYYSAIQYLMRPLFGDKEMFEKYRNMLSPLILEDFKEERLFWESHRGWVEELSGLFYDQYLKHNNQPEGMERYGMMVKLIVAWEKQKGLQ